MAIEDFEVQHYAQQQMLVPPTLPTHLATKQWVEDIVAGLSWDAVKAATDVNYDATLDAAFQVLTASANGALAGVDDVVLDVGDRVLLVGQTDKMQNGIYVVTDLGSDSTPWVLTRSGDANDADEFRPGKTVWVKPGGTTYSDVTFRLAVTTTVALGTDSIEFALNIASRLVEEHVAITGDGVSQDFVIEHTLGAGFLTYDAYDADFVPYKFVYAPITGEPNKVQVVMGIPLPDQKQVVITLRGTV